MCFGSTNNGQVERQAFLLGRLYYHANNVLEIITVFKYYKVRFIMFSN